MTGSDSQSEVSSSQLVADLNRLAKHAQMCIRYRALFIFATAVLAVLAILMLVDCLFQREEFGLRWMASLTLVATVVYATIRWLRPAQQLVIRPSDVARWVETHQPEWSGRILTTLELSQLNPNDERFGSQTFRSAALQTWQQASTQPQWDRLLDRSGLKLATGSALIMLMLFALSFFVWPDMGSRSLTRVLAPWADRPWPRRDQLHFVNLPNAVGRETVLQLEIADANPPLPENIFVQVMQVGSEESHQAIPAQIIGDIAVANLPPITSDIQVRAVGGDDSQMPWQSIRAVATPAWIQFHFDIKPPEYLRKIPSALDRLTKQLDPDRESYQLIGQRIQVVEGSSVRFEGKLDSPVKNVSVRVLGSTSSSSSGDDSKKVASSSTTDSPWAVDLVGQDSVVLRGNSNESMSILDRSLLWKFQIQSLEGVLLECPEKWQIEVIPDNPPEVALNPMTLKSLALGANLFFDGAARDDWGLSQLTARLVVNEDSQTEIELPLIIDPPYSKQIGIQNSWNIASELTAKGHQLKAQDQISFWIEARDVRGQTVRSSVERLYIEAKQKQLDAIANRQSSIAQQISELLNMQRSAQQLARRNADSIKQSDGQQTQQQIDAATSVAQLQQTIQQQLSEASQSVLSSIQSQLDLVEQNNLGDTPLANQLHSLKDRVSELADGAALDALKQADKLQQALESSVSSKQAANWNELTAELDNSQSKANQTLANLLEGLDRSEVANRQRDKLLQIAQQQAELMGRTEQLGLNAAKKPQDAQAELELLAASQNQLAGSTEQWLAAILQPDQSETDRQSSLREVAKSLVDQNTASQMRSSGASLRAQQLGEALQTQKQIQQTLQAAIENMSPRDSSELMSDLAEQEQQLRELTKAAQRLATAQQQLAGRMADPNAKAQSGQLAEEQENLLNSTEQLLDQLSSDRDAETLTQNAMANQSSAAQSAQANNLDESAKSASQAAQQLKDLAERVQRQAENANQQIQQQQMFELISAVEQIALRQKELMPQYDQLVRQLQLATLPSDHIQLRQALVKRQAAVRDQLRQLLPSAASLAIFQWVLQQADTDLTRAIAAAERNRLSPDAVNAAASGLRKMEIAINSVSENESRRSNQSQPGNQEQASEQVPDQQKESLPPIISLKLIRALQLDLKQQTEQLESSSDEDQSLRAAELMGQQRELAELLDNFINDLQSQQQNN